MAGDARDAGGDPFSAFWGDFWSRWGPAAAAGGGPATAGGQPAPPPMPDFSNHMRRAFLDALAQQADQFMRSEAFLANMKQAMDNSLAWQQMINQYLQKGLSAMQVPSKSDAEHIAMLVHGIESRLVEKLDDLGRRVAQLERLGGAGAAGAPAAGGEKPAGNEKSGGHEKPAGDKRKPRGV